MIGFRAKTHPAQAESYAACFTGVEIAAIAAAAVAAAGSIYSGIQQNNAAKYQARVAENNSIAAQQYADFEVTRQKRRAEQLRGSQVAAYSKAGVQIDDTPLDVLIDSAQEAELDSLAIHYSADMESARQNSAAALARMQGRAAQVGSYFRAGASVLNGAVNYYSLAPGVDTRAIRAYNIGTSGAAAP